LVWHGAQCLLDCAALVPHPFRCDVGKLISERNHGEAAVQWQVVSKSDQAGVGFSEVIAQVVALVEEVARLVAAQEPPAKRAMLNVQPFGPAPVDNLLELIRLPHRRSPSPLSTPRSALSASFAIFASIEIAPGDTVL